MLCFVDLVLGMRSWAVSQVQDQQGSVAKGETVVGFSRVSHLQFRRLQASDLRDANSAASLKWQMVALNQQKKPRSKLCFVGHHSRLVFVGLVRFLTCSCGGRYIIVSPDDPNMNVDAHAGSASPRPKYVTPTWVLDSIASASLLPIDSESRVDEHESDAME